MLVTIHMFDGSRDIIVEVADLVLEFTTTSNNTQFTIPCSDNGVFDAIINWGDGTDSQQILAYNSPNLTHTYSSSGNHQVSINGQFPNLYFNYNSDRGFLTKILSGGNFKFLGNAFEGCYNLNFIGETTNTLSVTDFTSAWSGCNNLTEFPLLDVSNGIDFNSAWRNCSSLTEFPLLDVSKGTNFSYAWDSCNSLETFPLLDVSNGTNFYFAWNGCNNLTDFPLLDVSNGIDFTYAWSSCSLTEFPLLDVSNGQIFAVTWAYYKGNSFPILNVSSGTSFSGCWMNCPNLVSFPLLDVSSGTNFEAAWEYCVKLEYFPANMFDNLSGQMSRRAFYRTWNGCNLISQSVENILVSIDSALITVHPNMIDSKPIDNEISIGTKAGETLTSAAITAISSLKTKLWIIKINGVEQ